MRYKCHCLPRALGALAAFRGVPLVRCGGWKWRVPLMYYKPTSSTNKGCSAHRVHKIEETHIQSNLMRRHTNTLAAFIQLQHNYYYYYYYSEQAVQQQRQRESWRMMELTSCLAAAFAIGSESGCEIQQQHVHVTNRSVAFDVKHKTHVNIAAYRRCVLRITPWKRFPIEVHNLIPKFDRTLSHPHMREGCIHAGRDDDKREWCVI